MVEEDNILRIVREDILRILGEEEKKEQKMLLKSILFLKIILKKLKIKRKPMRLLIF